MSPEFKLAFDAIKAAFPRKPEHLQRFYAGYLRDSGKDVQTWIAETKEKNAKAVAFDKKARALLREKFGAGNYRIHSNGAVSAYGKAPNSMVTCWWLYANDIEDAVRNLTDYFYTVSTAFSKLFGGVQYMTTKRNASDALIQQAIDKLYAKREEKPTVQDYRKCAGVFDWNGQNYENRRMRETLETISYA